MEPKPPVIRAPVVITTYADMYLRDGFTDELDWKAHKPAEILSEYHFDKEEVPCGLLGCKEPHKHGVLFLTESGGIESNMGHMCGARHFPGVYIAARNVFREKQAARAHLDVIGDYQAKAAEYKSAIGDIWYTERGGEWADRCLKMYTGACPAAVREKLVDMSRRGDWRITRDYKVDKDNAVGLGFRRDAEVETKVLGHIRGGAALLKSVSSVLKPVRDRISVYEQTDPATLSVRKRGEWAAWTLTIPNVLSEAEQIVAAAREFYSRGNLMELLKVAQGRDVTNVRQLILALGTVERDLRRRFG